MCAISMDIRLQRARRNNAYLVKDEKVTLFDTVKKPFTGDLIQNLRQVIDPKKIDYLVVNHVEMDHSGAVAEIINLIEPEKVFCSPMGKRALLEHFRREDWPFEVVESGRSLSLGNRTVDFLETRMLHWPDSMMSYLKGQRLLISSDGFGQHWATSERFDDEVDPGELLRHAAKYYANILLLYSPLVQKLLAQVRDLKLQIDMIAPDHGLIWRRNPGRIVEAYNEWSLQKCRDKAVIIYDTMWHSTECMAYAVGRGLLEEGVQYRLFNMRLSHRSDVITELLDARAVILGSPTLNNGIMPTMADMICYMKGLKPANRVGAAFGSYGWSGEAVKLLTEALEGMKIRVVGTGPRAKYIPADEDFAKCEELGRQVGRAVKEM